MSRYAIDARTLLVIISDNVVISPRHQLVAPNLIRSHALTLLLHAVRRGDITHERALAHLERVTEMKMRLLGDRVSRRTAWNLAIERNWETTYDAEYVAVARLQADALVTVDAAMASKAKGIVALAPIEALTANLDLTDVGAAAP